MRQADFLRHTIEVLESMGVSYMLVGSLASGIYGEARLTQDIDIVVRLDVDDIAVLERAFPGPDYYFEPAAAYDAIQRGGQFNVIHGATGHKVDFMIAVMDLYGRQQIARKRRMELLSGVHGEVAGPEDVILAKLRYFKEGASDKHLRDIAGIMAVSGHLIDHDYLHHWARELDVAVELKAALDRVEGYRDDHRR